MNIGLTLCKYAPLHAGHQYVIETALREMDVVYVLIYDEPTVTPIPLPVRAGWIRALYPNVHVIEAWDGPTESGYTPEIMAMHDATSRSVVEISASRIFIRVNHMGTTSAAG